MSALTPEQMQAFQDYKNSHQGEGFKDETLRGVVEDDIGEHDKSLERRAGWNRNYNHEPAKIEKRFTKEE
ncbi:MAG: hypothetical protein JNN11_04735 [Candidatus Doudnabacteria bacterium]|nr:hypothetical protein [Candidatus Doudnabacteria bacterium]